MDDDEVVFCISYLQSLFPLLAVHSALLTDDDVEDICCDPDHCKKSSGYPWYARGAPSKGACVERFGIAQIRQYYADYTTIIGATLKAEIRPIGKDARLFRPQDVGSFVEAATLFGSQNEHILAQLHSSPIFAKFVTPGTDIMCMFHQLHNFHGRSYSADGDSWDANFSLMIAAIIATWRAMYLPRERVERYYQMMYNGFTCVGGNLMNCVGQPSGHFNTTTDNSLAHCVMFALHAYRNGLTIEQLNANVLYRCCGDDLIWSDRTGVFTPALIAETYVSMGMYLSFDSLTPMSSYDLPFVGVQCHDKVINNRTLKLYAIRSKRAKANFALRKKGADDIVELQKYSSLCQLTFGDQLTYDLLYRATLEFVVQAQIRGSLTVTDPYVRGTLAAMQPGVLERAYLRLESIFAAGRERT